VDDGSNARMSLGENRVRSSETGLENLGANPAVRLLPVGDAQIDGASPVAESGNRNRVGSMEQSG
jgi:hypothetical protein